MSDPHTLVLTSLITGRIKVNLAAELPDVVAILKERVIAHFLNLSFGWGNPHNGRNRPNASH